MAKSERTDKQPRIIGYTKRMRAEVQVDVWKPPCETEVDELPALPAKQPRGWEVIQEPSSSPVASALPAPPPSSSMEGGAASSEVAVPPPPPPRPRPAHVQDGTLEAEVWEHPEDAAGLIRTMLMGADNGEDVSALQESEVSAETESAAAIPPSEQVAIALTGLGEELAGEIFKHLSEYEIEEISRAIGALKPVSARIRQQLLEEFRQRLRAGDWAICGGMDFARAVLERAVGPGKAQEILSRLSVRLSSGFHMLKNVAADQVAPFISHEHPQTIALILSQLEPAQAAGILGQLPERMQADVAYRMATMENITPHVIEQVEENLEAMLRDILGHNQDVGGPQVVADVINCSGSSVERNVLEQMEAQDAKAAADIRDLIANVRNGAGDGQSI